MKKRKSHLSVLALALIVSLAIFAGCESTSPAGSSSAASTSAAPTGNSAQLVIQRVADLGTLDILNVFVDGKQVGTLPRGQNYTGSLAPGNHVITVKIAGTNDPNAKATKRVTAKKGQTYTFTATWAGGTLQLQ